MKLILSAKAKTKAAALNIDSTDLGYKDFLRLKKPCKGQNANPAFTINNILPGTGSFTLSWMTHLLPAEYFVMV